jgi:hypothetical protein
VQILAFLAKRGKGGADRFTGKNRDAAERVVKFLPIKY